MSKRVVHWSGALSLVAGVVLAVAVGAAGAVRSSPVPVRVPAVGFRLHADLAPVGSATGSGRFDALLIRTGPGQVRVGGTLPGASASPRVICPPNTNPAMGIPCRIGGGGGLPPFQVPPVPPVGVHWMLVWRLALSGVTGPASASIHLGTQGVASPILSTLCTGCQVVATGHLAVTAYQAQLLLKGDGYVDVQAASGGLSGHIVAVSHFFFSAPVRRSSR
jgi:hypothetical protein